MQIVARVFTHDQFKAYVQGLKIPDWAKFITVHNTSSPDIKLYTGDWMKRDPKKWSPEIWLRNLTSYYKGLGWNGCPHLFIPPAEDQIMVLNALTVPGTHTPSWNKFAIGVETVGEFEREAFGDPTRANLVTALAVLHEKLGLRPDGFLLGGNTPATAGRGLHFHKEDKATTHRTCPGRNMVKADLVNRILAEMGHEPQMQPVETLDDHHDVPLASQTAETNGMSMEELTSIKWLQTMLNRWDTSLKLVVDGIVAPLGTFSPTRFAIMKFQKANDLVADGIPGPVTRATLKAKVK